jgi:hypothetical protein
VTARAPARKPNGDLGDLNPALYDALLKRRTAA